MSSRLGHESVIAVLDEAISNGTIHQGDLAVTFAFGGGLSLGADLIRI
ncbi:MAG: 3-oxoacyl-[acyl-carrier-protein] synthase III C-terminal domain-containing protein [Syntrophobacteraceae bacterium]